MPTSQALAAPGYASTSPLVPIAFRPDAPARPEERSQRVRAFAQTLTREYSLPSDDPIHAHLAAIEFHEDALAQLIERDEKSRAEQTQAYGQLFKDAQSANERHLAAVKAQADRLDEAGAALARKNAESVEDQAAFRTQIGEVQAGLTEYKTNLVDAKKLGETMTNATKTLTKRALWESLVSYLLPLIGAILGAIFMYAFMSKSGLVLQIVPGQPAPVYQAVPSQPANP